VIRVNWFNIRYTVPNDYLLRSNNYSTLIRCLNSFSVREQMVIAYVEWSSNSVQATVFDSLHNYTYAPNRLHRAGNKDRTVYCTESNLIQLNFNVRFNVSTTPPLTNDSLQQLSREQ